MSEIRYLEELSREAPKRHKLDDIKRAIDEQGFWQCFDEWRISTTTEKRIEKTERDGKTWFKVQVKCDHEFTCHSPTIERAVEFLGIYDQLIMDLFYTLGWPSWASKKRVEV